MPFTRRRKWLAILTAVGVALIIAAAVGIRRSMRVERVAVITGAVIAENEDPHLQRPIANAAVTAVSETTAGKSVSASSGLFRLRLDPPVTAGEMVELTVEHPGYRRYAISTPAGGNIYVVRLSPRRPPPEVLSDSGRTRISNLRVRYATRTTSMTTIGTAVRTFDIVNTGNVPCGGRPPCSPDGKWKAAIGSLSLDAGEHKQFRNVRVSCIAGPCPFTAIDADRFSAGGRKVTVSVRNWSDRVTYLFEAEVAETIQDELIRHTYPVTFGRSMNFTLPSVASGLTIEADLDGSQIMFPLGPQLRLSWANCRSETGPEGTKQYRCELKQGFQFQ